MRILFCTLGYPPSPTGGAEKQAQLVAERLVRRGHVVHVVCPSVNGSKSGTVNGVRVHRLPVFDRRPFRTLTYLPLLFVFLLVRLSRFDLVHVHLANLQADVAVLAATFVRRPSYLKLAAGGRLGEIGRLRKVAWLTRYYGIRHATLIQAISAEIFEDLTKIGVPLGRIRRIPNGVALSGSPGRRLNTQDGRRRLGLPEDALVVLYVGRMEREKGVHDLISAWESARIPSGLLLLVGSAGIKDPAPTRQLPPRTFYVGWSSEIQSYLSVADIFVLPSYVEGMSNALLEAMSAGVPCIATCVGATPDIIRDGVNGLTIAPGDRMALIGALEAFAADGKLRDKIGAAAQESVRANYEIGAVVRTIEAAYRSIVTSK
jgi:glycosyltransferase involved in cell wall biosynthesis